MIEVMDLTKYYGNLCALDRINFQIHKGEVLGMLGPNGAGKTTCMRILTCYLNPTSGNITVKGMNVTENPRSIKQIMGYLPENAPLYPEMLVFDYLEYVADSRRLDREAKQSRIDFLSHICGIREVMHQPIGELSKGYKQRVGLAQAMMGDPEILVLDEPTSGLDPNQIVEIREIIREIGREKTVILSTHILSEAEATCDRAVIIHQGRIVADGDITALKESAGRDTRIVVTLAKAEAGKARSVLKKVPGVMGIDTESHPGDSVIHLSLAVEPGKDIRVPVYHAIKAEDWDLLELQRQSKSLEHIFRELTKENVQ
ncbi:MAG TPA: ATP-binding cassette domain-containing protein [Candidatus Aminicenantes bacterium]|nr:ATP-binding cassette domain-containing protein [Candidatus Aminicenantes bacterium]